jgi:hypothetical protein
MKVTASRVLVAHTCNPSYLGGTDQEAPGSKPALGKQFERTYLENTQPKRAGGVAQGIGPEFKVWYCKKKKKRKRKKS